MKWDNLLVIILCCVISLSPLLGQTNFGLELESRIDLPDGDLANDIWGYEHPDTGVKYAIVGGRRNYYIFSLEDTVDPILRKTIPGQLAIWRDMKSYGNYVYGIADEGDEGLTIIDMSAAPDSISYTQMQLAVQLPSGRTDFVQRGHNIYIDEKARMFLAGTNIRRGGVLIYDLAENPSQPSYLGIQDRAYSHDVIAQGDTMFSAEIFSGTLAIYDISDMTDIKYITSFNTSTNFTHNAWMSDNGQYIYTTDERPGSSVDAYDIRDYDNIERVDSYNPSRALRSTPHNAHFKDDYIVTSWYTEGVIVLDAQRPHNLVKVAQYDTDPGDAFGCWGAYPYFDDSTIIASDIENGYFGFKADYRRAAYLEGKILNNSGQGINTARVEINAPQGDWNLAGPNGDYATGLGATGAYSIEVKHPNYADIGKLVFWQEGALIAHDFKLATDYDSIQVKVLDEALSPIENVLIYSAGVEEAPQVVTVALTNTDGEQVMRMDNDNQLITLGKWGYGSTTADIQVSADAEFQYELLSGIYEDDFWGDLGWQATQEEPSRGWKLIRDGQDMDDDLGPGAYHCIAALDKPMYGLTSPAISIEDTEESMILEFYAQMLQAYEEGEYALEVRLISETDTIIEVIDIDRSVESWEKYTVSIPQRIAQDSFRVAFFFGSTNPSGSKREVILAIDQFSIQADISSSTENITDAFVLSPNPAQDQIELVGGEGYNVANGSHYRISNSIGQVLQVGSLQGTIDVSQLRPGQYYISFFDTQNRTHVSSFIKL